MTLTQGYPYFLQEWGKHTWAAAQGPSHGMTAFTVPMFDTFMCRAMG